MKKMFPVFPMYVLFYVRTKYIQKQPFTDVLQNGVHRNFTIVTGKTPGLESFFNKVADLGLQFYLKKTPTQVFFCENCEFFKNCFFFTAPPVTAS